MGMMGVLGLRSGRGIMLDGMSGRYGMYHV